MTGHPPSDNPWFGKGVCVMFPGNKGDIDCYLTELSRTPSPPLPGGDAVGDRVLYTGKGERFPSGVKLTRGQPGEVAGHPLSDSCTFGKGVAVMFPDMAFPYLFPCFLTELDEFREPPVP